MRLQVIGFLPILSSALLLSLSLGVSGVASPSVGQRQERFAGVWVGAVEFPSGPMTIKVVHTDEAGGALRGTLFNSEGVGHPIRVLRTWGDSISFGTMRDPTFFGELREDTITGIMIGRSGRRGVEEERILPVHLRRDPGPSPG